MLEQSNITGGRYSSLLVLTLVFGSCVGLPILGAVFLSITMPAWSEQSAPFHSCLEISGATLGLVLAAHIQFSRRVAITSRKMWIVCAFLAMFVLDGFHSVVSPGEQFVWLHSMAVLVGGVLFGLVLLPDRKISRTTAYCAAGSTLVVTTLVCIHALLSPTSLPAMVIDGDFTILAESFNVLGGLLMLSVSGLFTVRFHRTKSVEELQYLVLTLLFGISGLFFFHSTIWDAGWWFWHILRFSAYVLTFLVALSLVHRAEENLTVSEDRLREIVETTIDWVWEVDTEGRYTYCSDRVEEVLGYSVSEMLGKTPFDLVSPEEKEQVSAIFGEYTSKLEPFRDLENWTVAKGGRNVCLMTSGSPILLKSGECVGYRGVDSDITERKRAEEALAETLLEMEVINSHFEETTLLANDMAVKAELASAAKSEFLANMSHEIRTPMNGVIGMTCLLLDTALGDDQRHYAKTVLSSAEALLGLLNDILDFSKIEAGRLELEQLDFDLRALLDDFASTISLRTEELGVEFICAAAPDVPSLLSGDPSRLRQVLLNLTGNAIKFTSEGEISVRLGLEKEEEDKVELRVSVCDTGIGIPKKKLSILFDKFAQVDTSTTRNYGGTGLGLAISKQLVELMGGRIGVNSEEGRGSEFWFTISLKMQQNQDASPFPTPASLERVRVLVVDDNSTNCDVIVTQLSSWGMITDQAFDGPTALQKLYAAVEVDQPYQLALIDKQMPGMDGEALGRAIKNDKSIGSVSLILMAAMGVRGDAKHFDEIGYAAYMLKPIKHVDLHDCMVEVISGEASPGQDRSLVTRHSLRESRRIRARILLAEDNVTNQQVALGILRKLGFSADVVVNGAEAVSTLRDTPYDLVFMDVQMPEMDGIEATTAIRALGDGAINAGIPIIAMTAHAMQRDRDRCYSAGMNGYVTKPITPLALSSVLEEWLKESPNREEGEADNAVELPEPQRKPAHESADLVEAADGQTANPNMEGAADTTVFDATVLVEMLMGDRELASVIIGEFLEDMLKQIDALASYLEGSDTESALRQAHTIKGAAANVGCRALSEFAAGLEKAAKGGKLEEVSLGLPELRARLARVDEAVASAGFGT